MEISLWITTQFAGHTPISTEPLTHMFLILRQVKCIKLTIADNPF